MLQLVERDDHCPAEAVLLQELYAPLRRVRTVHDYVVQSSARCRHCHVVFLVYSTQVALKRNVLGSLFIFGDMMSIGKPRNSDFETVKE